MRIKDKITRDVIKPFNDLKMSQTIGIITEYDKEYNIANVTIKSPFDCTAIELKYVPVQIPGNGVHVGYPKVNDRVYIQFNEESFFSPKIIAFADEEYSKNTKKKEEHRRKGSYIVDDVKKMDRVVTPFMNVILNKQRTDADKYISYRHKEPIVDLQNSTMHIGKFDDEEVGLYNPTNSSLVKIDKDGNVLIFVSTNVGLKLDTKRKKINIFGDLEINSDNIKINGVDINDRLLYR